MLSQIITVLNKSKCEESIACLFNIYEGDDMSL